MCVSSGYLLLFKEEESIGKEFYIIQKAFWIF